MRILASFLLLLFSVPCISLAQTSNAGFVQGLWYSSETVFADRPVRIYAAIRNNTGSDLTGVVEFFDNGTRIARNSVSSLDGRIIESWADWTPTYGEHTITASLSRTELHAIGSDSRDIDVISASAEDTIFVDYDTDGDGVGNKQDIDDDGDGISDAVEEQNGTNPLVYDEPIDEDTEEDVEPESESEGVSNSENADDPQGLEQYLTDSIADRTLSGITQYVNQTKKRLDTYRRERSSHQDASSGTLDIAVNEDGFGEIERTSSEEKVLQLPQRSNSSSATTSSNSPGFMTTVTDLLGTLANTAYTVLLAALSFLLGHPILVQVALLLLILFTLYFLARKFGRRRST